MSKISRRKFCTLSALASLALLLTPRRAKAAISEDGGTKNLRGRCRIDVLRCNCFTDLQGRYLDDPEAGPCSHFKVGETIEITPRNLEALLKEGRICPNAWHSLEPYVMAALSAGETDDCAPAAKVTEAVVSCPDGTRPVIFKVSAV